DVPALDEDREDRRDDVREVALHDVADPKRRAPRHLPAAAREEVVLVEREPAAGGEEREPRAEDGAPAARDEVCEMRQGALDHRVEGSRATCVDSERSSEEEPWLRWRARTARRRIPARAKRY